MGTTFFATAADFRAWLVIHHDAEEISLGFHKTSSGGGGNHLPRGAQTKRYGAKTKSAGGEMTTKPGKPAVMPPKGSPRRPRA